MYDPTTDRYHLHYQWHPNHVNWGNISWGHATSKDMITWTDVGGWEDDQAQSVGTGPFPDSDNSSYYGLGIFSGSAQPVNLQGQQDGTLIAFYTSVQYLPTNWALPYIKGTESQSIVISNDGGETWEQYAGNPIMTEPPSGWNITGWRDPFVEVCHPSGISFFRSLTRISPGLRWMPFLDKKSPIGTWSLVLA